LLSALHSATSYAVGSICFGGKGSFIWDRLSFVATVIVIFARRTSMCYYN